MSRIMVCHYRSAGARKSPAEAGLRIPVRRGIYFLFCFSVFFALVGAGAAAATTGARRDFFDLGGLDVRRHDHRVRLAVRDDLGARGQLDVAHVQRLALGQLAEVDGDELGQLRGQALDVRPR